MVVRVNDTRESSLRYAEEYSKFKHDDWLSFRGRKKLRNLMNFLK